MKKICTKCKIEKPFIEFFKKKAAKDGYKSSCKSCAKLLANEYKKNNNEKVLAQKASWAAKNPDYGKEHYAKNKDVILSKSKEYYSKNKAKVLTANKIYKEKNKEKALQSTRDWCKNNPDRVTELSTRKRAKKLQRTPKWLTIKDWEEIKKIYKKSYELTKTTGVQHHVDHIIPLQGKTVSGFHCPSNLQILTAKENMEKGNKLLQGLKPF